MLFKIVDYQTSDGLRFGEALCKIFGGPLGARKNLSAPFMQKFCVSDMFRVHQYTNWCQSLNLTFRCIRSTFSVQTYNVDYLNW